VTFDDVLCGIFMLDILSCPVLFYLFVVNFRGIIMIFDHYEYSICGHYLSALINGDFSGLDDAEEKELDDWVNSLPVHGHFDVIDEEPSFKNCDISNLHGDTYKVHLVFEA
jgi:hypothetical protein